MIRTVLAVLRLEKSSSSVKNVRESVATPEGWIDYGLADCGIHGLNPLKMPSCNTVKDEIIQVDI